MIEPIEVRASAKPMHPASSNIFSGRRLFRTLLAATASSLGLFHAVAGAAQPLLQDDAPASPAAGVPIEGSADGQIQDIIVTAQRRQENVNRIGMSISVLNSASLQQQGIRAPSDLVKLVPGFNYTRSAYGVPVYTLRGIGFYDTSLAGSPTVSVNVDEVPLPYSAMTIGAGLDVERVEVLKGPQGTLYGQNSTGGAVNYISSRPTQDFQAGFDATYASFNEADITGYLSGGLTDNLAVRAAVRVNEGGNWQRSYTRDAKRGKSDLLVGRLLVDWLPSESFKLQLNLNAWRDKSEEQAAQFGGVIGATAAAVAAAPAIIRNYPVPPRDNRAADWDPERDFARDDSFYQASGRATLDLSDTLTITSLTSYQSLDRSSASDVDGTAFPNYYVTQVGSIRSFYQELRLNGELGPDVKFIVGGNYGRDKVFEETSPFAPSGFSTSTFTSASSVGETKVKRVAAFGNVDLTIAPTLTIQGGVRYTESRRHYEGCTTGVGNDLSFPNQVAATGNTRRGSVLAIPFGQCATLGPAPTFVPGLFVGDLNEDNVSWRLNANWQVASTALLYANVSKGFKEGVFPVSGATFAFSLAPAVQEEVLAYEAGFKLSLADRHVQLNGAIFHYDYTNKQIRGRISDPVLGRQNRLINIPKGIASGAELQATIVPLAGLTVNGGVTYVHTKISGSTIVSDALGNSLDVQGERFPITPKWQGQLGVDYSFAVRSGIDLFVGGNYSYQGATNSGLGNLPALRIPSYTIVDARAGVRASDNKWSLMLFARNLGDSYYWTFVNFASPNVAARYTGRPRTFGLTLTTNFR